jgi:hypothetical protein
MPLLPPVEHRTLRGINEAGSSTSLSGFWRGLCLQARSYFGEASGYQRLHTLRSMLGDLPQVSNLKRLGSTFGNGRCVFR